MGNVAAEPVLAVFEARYAELVAFVRRKVRCAAAAADIVQDTYVRLAGRQTPAAVADPEAFVRRVAANLAVDHLRRERIRGGGSEGSPAPDELPDARPPIEAAIHAQRRLALLARAVDELPPRCRQVFVMRKLEGRGQAEIAAALGISRNMVEKHLRKALLHCAARLGEAG